MILLHDLGSSSQGASGGGFNLVLTQPARGYRYSLDSFLVAEFCQPRARERILDLGAGVGVIGLLLARRHPTVSVIGIELQRDLALHAAENARANALEERCRFIRGDLREAPRYLPPEHFHRVVANPPFRRTGTGAVAPDRNRAGARHEFTFSLDDLAGTAAALLRCGGALDVIHLAERLPDLFRALAAAGLEPKTLRHVAPFPGAPPHRVLLSALKGGRPGLRTLPLLVLNDGEKTPTGQVVAAP